MKNMRETIRTIKCSECGKTWQETVYLEDDEDDDYFDVSICDECEDNKIIDF